MVKFLIFDGSSKNPFIYNHPTTTPTTKKITITSGEVNQLSTLSYAKNAKIAHNHFGTLYKVFLLYFLLKASSKI